MDSSTSSKLALIYSRLAELEILKEKKNDVWEDVTRRFGPADLDPVEITNIEAIIQDATQGFLLDDGKVSGDAISRVRMLFLAEHQFSQSLESSLRDKVKKVHAFQSERDGHASEVFMLREAMMKIEARTADLEELCRNMQKLAKEKDDQRQQLVELERSKSEHLETECLQSIAAVTKKIEQEEQDLEAKEQENLSLKEKLDEFVQHMTLRKEKRMNEARAKELEERLREARRAQHLYLKDQEAVRYEARKTKIRQLEEGIIALRRQLNTYAEKFEEFEDTLDRSTAVIDKINDREQALAQILEKLRHENSILKNRAAEADVSVIVGLEQRRGLEQELVPMRTQYDKLEKKCRKLLARRQELQRLVDGAAPSVPRATVETLPPPVPSSSSSSSSSAALRNKTPSPTQLQQQQAQSGSSSSAGAVPSSSSSSTSAISTPTRKNKATVASSSSMSSPTRPSSGEYGATMGTAAGGEESPTPSPNVALRKRVDDA